MKRKLSLILAIVMIASVLFGLSAMAEATDTVPPAGEETPEVTVSYDNLDIAYSNVNYTEELYMMFAVPVIENLPETHKVKLLLWNHAEDGDAFSYSDALVNEVDPEAEKTTINGVEHYVFKCAVGAEMMTDIICVRPAVLTEKKGAMTAVAYGDVVDYSVLEYVKTAKGEFEGIPAIDNAAHLNLLDSMLKFGATAQIYLGGDEPYGEFLATDEVHKIWVTPIIGGVERAKAFAGFFKYEEGFDIEIFPPHYDGLSAIKAFDAEGKVIEDFTVGAGIVVERVNGDIEIKVEYDTHVIRQIDVEALGVGASVNTVSQKAEGGNNVATWSSPTSVGLGNKTTANFSAASTPEGGKDGKNQRLYHGVKVVADKDNPENAYLQWTATDYSAISFSGIAPNDYAGTGYGDTVYPSITIELKVGMVNGKMMNTGYYYMRHRLSGTAAGADDKTGTGSYPYINFFKFRENGDIVVRGTSVDEEGQLEELVIGKVPEQGFVRVAIVIDARAETYHCYVSDENDDMQYILSTPIYYDNASRWELYRAKHQANLADDDPSNDNTLIAYESLENWFKYSTLENAIVGAPNWKTEYNDAMVEVGGEMVPVKDPTTGLYNLLALQAKAEEECSLLFDDYRIVIGDVYGSTYD